MAFIKKLDFGANYFSFLHFEGRLFLIFIDRGELGGNHCYGRLQEIIIGMLPEINSTLDLNSFDLFSYKSVITSNMSTSIIDSYMIFLQTLNPEVRLDIIARLAQSLKSEFKPKKNLFAKSFGAWSGGESALEIVKGIKDSRTFNRQIEGL